MKIKFLKLFLTISLSLSCYAESYEGDPKRVWVFAVYSSTITKNRIAPFIDALSNHIKTDFIIWPSTNVRELINSCESEIFEIVILPRASTEKIPEKCGYIPGSETLQDVFLFVQKSRNISNAKGIRKLGLIRGLSANEIAIDELSEVNTSFTSVIYSNYAQFVKNSINDGIDAFAMPMKTKEAATTHKQWEVLRKLSKQGSVQFLFHKSISQNLRENIIAFLHSGNSIVEEVFQKGFGLGDFRLPHNQGKQNDLR